MRAHGEICMRYFDSQYQVRSVQFSHRTDRIPELKSVKRRAGACFEGFMQQVLIPVLTCKSHGNGWYRCSHILMTNMLYYWEHTSHPATKIASSLKPHGEAPDHEVHFKPDIAVFRAPTCNFSSIWSYKKRNGEFSIINTNLPPPSVYTVAVACTPLPLF